MPTAQAKYEPAQIDGLHGAFPKVLEAHEQMQQDQAAAAVEAKRAAEDRKLEAQLAKQKQEEEEILQKAEKEQQKAAEQAEASKKGEGKIAPGEKARPAPKRKKKQPKEDIFHDFGKEHDDAPIQEVKVNGMVVHRLNYKRYFQSDRDLKRWGEALDNHTRYERLIFKVRDRWHEDLTGDRLELKIQHNSLVRSRTERTKPASSASVALQLRELQKQVAPKDNKKKKGAKGPGLEGLFGGGGGLGATSSLVDDPAETFAYQAPEEDVIAPTARSNGPDSVLDSPSSHSRRRPSNEHSRPQQEMTTSASAPTLQVASTMPPKFPVEMPSTMSLLLFRNGDRLHTGETLFIKRWPPPGGLQELLQVCTTAIKPVLAPARCLFDNELNPVRSLDQVIAGGVYLMKGMEGFDPPKIFFNHEHIKDGSLRQLKRAKDVISAELDPLEHFSQVPSHALSLSKASLYGERQPCVDSPPWGSRAPPPKPPKSEKWEVDEFLGMTLSWSGQGVPNTHKYYDQWKPVLQTAWRVPPRSIDRASSTASF